MTTTAIYSTAPTADSKTQDKDSGVVLGGMTQEELNNFLATATPQELDDFWQSLPQGDIDTYLQNTTYDDLPVVDSYIAHMNYAQACHYLNMANPEERNYAIGHMSPALLAQFTGEPANTVVVSGMTHAELDNFLKNASASQITSFWNNLSQQDLSDFMQHASMFELNGYFKYLSQTSSAVVSQIQNLPSLSSVVPLTLTPAQQAQQNTIDSLKKQMQQAEDAGNEALANGDQAAADKDFQRAKDLQAQALPLVNALNQSLGNATSTAVINALNDAVSKMPPADQKKVSELGSLIGTALAAQAKGDTKTAATVSSKAAQIAQDIADADIGDHTSLFDAIADLMALINTLNNMMGGQANLASTLAKANEAYTNAQSQMLKQAQVGDPWNPTGADWSNDKSSDHGPNSNPPYQGSGFGTGYYVPGIDNIPPDAKNSSGDNVAGYWQTVANQNYQLIQITFQGWVTETQAWAQNASDFVNNLGTGIPNDLQEIGGMTQLWSNLASLLR